MDSILTYLAEHKAALVGATATVLEVMALVINFWRKNRVAKQVQILGADLKNETKLQKFLWAANPINLFRKA